MRRTICITFDSCVHLYKSPWSGPHNITDGLVPGFPEWVSSVSRKYDIYVITTRPIKTVQQWLHDKLGDLATDMKVGTALPPADIYIDARAFLFEGEYPTIAQIEEMMPWQKRPNKSKPKKWKMSAEKAMREAVDLANRVHIKDCTFDPNECPACAIQDVLNAQLKKL